MAPVPARLLDLTRLVSRYGRGPLTGVDRVEAAYLSELLSRDTPLFGLVQTAAGFLLLDRAGMQGAADLAAGAPLGDTDLLSRLTNWRNPLRGRAEATVRRLAMGRATRPGLGRLIAAVPEGSSYLNTGHSNLSDPVLAQLHRRFRIAVLVHDTIPLDRAEFSRADTVAAFGNKITAISRHADLVIHTAAATRQRTEVHFAAAGRVPDGIVASLGVRIPKPTQRPPGLVPRTPYFITLGTVEPRKNHALLLQVWKDLARTGPPPPLLVIGARGWADPGLFDLLATTPGITLLSGLADGAVAALLQGAAALLFPSMAEGFGLPPVEAAALGIPVVASDLPVLREVLGDYPIYLDPADSYSWLETIKTLSLLDARDHRKPALAPPSWEDHFNTVLTTL